MPAAPAWWAVWLSRYFSHSATFRRPASRRAQLPVQHLAAPLGPLDRVRRQDHGLALQAHGPEHGAALRVERPELEGLPARGPRLAPRRLRRGRPGPGRLVRLVAVEVG